MSEITKQSLLDVLPVTLGADESAAALADGAAELIAGRLEEIDALRIISNIDGLPEGVLDILARDFKVDWYDLEYSKAEKQETVKSSWKVHKKLGTKTAIESALRAIYPDTTVQPWWEYDGEPYHFRIIIQAGTNAGTEDKQKRVLEKLDYYKSLRDTVDRGEIRVNVAAEMTLFFAGIVSASETISIDLPEPDLTDYEFYEDQDGNLLTDEHGDLLYTGGSATDETTLPDLAEDEDYVTDEDGYLLVDENGDILYG
jgi:phage tail P2-like protein